MTSPQPSSQQAQARQAAITALLVAQMAKVWSLIDLGDLKTSLPKYEAAVAALTYKFGQVSAAQAALFYREMRAAAAVGGRFRPTGADPAGIGQVQQSIGWATKGLYSETPNVEAAKTLANGVAQKLVVDTGRNTLIAAIEQDQKARGWAREAKPDACSFCALLATRGAVYRSETSASFEAHDHCHCLPVPLFADHYEPPAYVRQWQQIYRDAPYGANAGEARNNFRVALADHRAGQTAQPVNA